MSRPPNKHDFNRPVDWRWKRAMWLNEDGRHVNLPNEDKFVLRARQFHDEVRLAADDWRYEVIKSKYPHLTNAYELFTAPDQRMRRLVEARLLTREAVERTAKRTSIPKETIVWYERIFYNVRDRLNAPDYICTIVLGEGLQLGLKESDISVRWKLYAYFGGPGVLDDQVTTMRNAEAEAFYDSDIRGTVKRRMSSAVRGMPLAYNYEVITSLYSKLKEIDKSDAPGAQKEQALIDGVASVLGALGDSLAVGRRAKPDSPKLITYDTAPGELRVTDMMNVLQGDEDEAMAKVNTKFPDPPDKNADDDSR